MPSFVVDNGMIVCTVINRNGVAILIEEVNVALCILHFCETEDIAIS